MGVSEVRWKDGCDFVSDGYRVMYAGGPRRLKKISN